jgi:hypothetical protein
MTSNQHESRASRCSFAEVIDGNSETTPYASDKKLGERPVFDRTNWVDGECGEPLPIAGHESVPVIKTAAVHEPLIEADSFDAIRSAIGSASKFDFLGWALHWMRRGSKPSVNVARGAPIDAEDFGRKDYAGILEGNHGDSVDRH